MKGNTICPRFSSGALSASKKDGIPIHHIKTCDARWTWPSSFKGIATVYPLFSPTNSCAHVLPSANLSVVKNVSEWNPSPILIGQRQSCHEAFPGCCAELISCIDALSVCLVAVKLRCPSLCPHSCKVLCDIDLFSSLTPLTWCSIPFHGIGEVSSTKSNWSQYSFVGLLMVRMYLNPSCYKGIWNQSASIDWCPWLPLLSRKNLLISLTITLWYLAWSLCSSNSY